MSDEYQDRLTEIQDILDASIVRAMEKYSLNLDRAEAAEAHSECVNVLFAYANDLASKEDLKSAFRQWIEAAKVPTVEALINGTAMVGFTEPRKCYSLGCPGLVRFKNGKGVCPFCNLSQIIIALDGRLSCMSVNYSEETSQSEPSKVVSLATRRKLKASGLDRSRNEASLF